MVVALRRILTWTLAIGVTAFAAGFFGPIIFAPSANQGPLLGIFVTGPLGMVVGLVVGVSREALGYTGGPLDMFRGAGGSRSAHESPAWLLRLAATGAGAFLFLYGLTHLRGGGRGPASAVVVGVALIVFGVRGRMPGWFGRRT